MRKTLRDLLKVLLQRRTLWLSLDAEVRSGARDHRGEVQRQFQMDKWKETLQHWRLSQAEAPGTSGRAQSVCSLMHTLGGGMSG